MASKKVLDKTLSHQTLKAISERYFVSESGEVFSKNKKTKPLFKLIKQYDRGNGYMHVTIYVNKKRKTFSVHRLVAKAFLKPIDGKNYVNHKDNNKLNNNMSNLEWCTPKENAQHASLVGALRVGLSNSMGKLSKADVYSIIESRLPSRDLGKVYNVSKTTVLNIKKRKTHKYLAVENGKAR